MSTDLIDATGLDRLLADAVPLLDVRAPIEYARGAFPAAINLPLLDDVERSLVGTCYRQAGQAAAIALGEQLVSGARRAERIEAWRRFVASHPVAAVCCWRGGLRSRISQRWLAESGLPIARIEGGYKAMRMRAIAVLEAASSYRGLVVVGGRTGVGKTAFLASLPGAIDLEALACHRGSAFGARTTAQPSQTSFENALACALLAHARDGHSQLLLEDESRRIGNLTLPPQLYAALGTASVLVLELPFAERVANIRNEYVVQALAELAPTVAAASSRAAVPPLAARLLAAVDRIRRRLGDEAHARVRMELNGACAAHARDGDARAHDGWIALLLERYYDPMYDHQLERKRSRIRTSGDAEALRASLAANGPGG